MAQSAIAEGTFVLAAAAENTTALAPPAEKYTAFTGELVDLLENGDPAGPEFWDMNTLYKRLLYELKARGRPEPQKRDRNTAGDLMLFRNRAWPVPTRSQGSQRPKSSTKVGSAAAVKLFLVGEDDPVRAKYFQQFARHYSDNGVIFKVASSAANLITTLRDPATRSSLSGVVTNFDFGGQRADQGHKRLEVEEPSGRRYFISTGIGVLDWIHTTEPSMPLWAATYANSPHAPLFMSAASLWFGAKPLDIGRVFSAGTPLGHGLLNELQAPDSHANLNQLWQLIEHAQFAFEELLNTPYGGIEAFDWLHALTHLPARPGGFVQALTARIRNLTLNPDVRVHANTIAPKMAKWQLCLEEMYLGFPINRDEDAWPHFDEARLPKSLISWTEFNPFTDFLGRDTGCSEFFGANDVRVALARWREAGIAAVGSRTETMKGELRSDEPLAQPRRSRQLWAA